MAVDHGLGSTPIDTRRRWWFAALMALEIMRSVIDIDGARQFQGGMDMLADGFGAAVVVLFAGIRLVLAALTWWHVAIPIVAVTTFDLATIANVWGRDGTWIAGREPALFALSLGIIVAALILRRRGGART